MPLCCSSLQQIPGYLPWLQTKGPFIHTLRAAVRCCAQLSPATAALCVAARDIVASCISVVAFTHRAAQRSAADM